MIQFILYTSFIVVAFIPMVYDTVTEMHHSLNVQIDWTWYYTICILTVLSFALTVESFLTYHHIKEFTKS